MERNVLLTEYVGSLILTTTVISSGILSMAFTGGDVGLSVLIIAFSTGFVVFALVESLGPVSGCHINPVVTLSAVVTRAMDVTTGIKYVIVQIAGGITAAALSHAMFEMPLFAVSDVVRLSYGTALSEIVTTFGLVMVIFCCVRRESRLTPLAIGLYVVSAVYWTSSTSFANPQVTIGRIFTDTLTGIRPTDAVAFIVMQAIGSILATGFYCYIYPKGPEE
ncbi:MAG: aquaporin [Methanosarcinales archaeon Met12]|nr:MAG: aquaporin [Methanosarcinales archaeon Met12]